MRDILIFFNDTTTPVHFSHDQQPHVLENRKLYPLPVYSSPSDIDGSPPTLLAAPTGRGGGNLRHALEDVVRASSTARRKRIAAVRFDSFFIGRSKHPAQWPDAFSRPISETQTWPKFSCGLHHRGYRPLRPRVSSSSDRGPMHQRPRPLCLLHQFSGLHGKGCEVVSASAPP
jgi:hypothetical protein